MNVPYQFVTNQQLGYAPPNGVAPPPASTCAGGIGPNLAALANAQGNLVVPVAALINAAQMVGVYPGDPATAQGNLLNACEMAWREYSLKTTVSLIPGGYYGRTAVYDAVHASEKGALSFQMGQVFCALVAQEAGVPPGLFMHLDRWRRVAAAVPLVFRSNREPDFISLMGPNSFQVWEAKCRNTNGVDWASLRDGFSQAWSVASAAGLAPTANVATLARTDPQNGQRWEVYAVDPGDPEPAPLAPAAEDALFREYYGPLVGILHRSKSQARTQPVGKTTFVTVPSSADCSLGLDQRLLLVLQQDRRKPLPPGGLADALNRILGESYVNSQDTPLQYVNLNGVLSVAGHSWLKL